MLVFFVDIFIYNQYMETHVENLKTIFELMKMHQLVAKYSKCIFGSKHVKYLRFIITEDWFFIIPKKIKTIID